MFETSLKERHFTVSLKTSGFIFYLIAFNCRVSKRLEHEQEKSDKLSEIEKKHPEEHHVTNWVNWPQVNDMTQYKKSIWEGESLSEVNMGRDYPICEKPQP